MSNRGVGTKIDLVHDRMIQKKSLRIQSKEHLKLTKKGKCPITSLNRVPVGIDFHSDLVVPKVTVCVEGLYIGKQSR